MNFSKTTIEELASYFKERGACCGYLKDIQAIECHTDLSRFLENNEDTILRFLWGIDLDDIRSEANSNQRDREDLEVENSDLQSKIGKLETLLGKSLVPTNILEESLIEELEEKHFHRSYNDKKTLSDY